MPIDSHGAAIPAESPEWTPANGVERALWHCLDAGDTVGFLRVLCTADLFLPGFRPVGTADPLRLLSTGRGDRTYLSVFTSPEALYRVAGDVVDGWHLTGMAELAGRWPDERWGLAVNPGLPVAGYLEPDQVARVGAILAGQPPFEPDGVVDEALHAAVRAADPLAYVMVLMAQPVLVARDGPHGYRVGSDDRGSYLAVYTSERWLVEDGDDPASVTPVDFATLAGDWPDPACRLVANRGSAIALDLPGEGVPGLPGLVAAARIVTPALSD